LVVSISVINSSLSSLNTYSFIAPKFNLEDKVQNKLGTKSRQTNTNTSQMLANLNSDCLRSGDMVNVWWFEWERYYISRLVEFALCT